MTPTVTTPDPAVFPEDVRRFAAERGVTAYLVPLYELTRRCFPGAEIAVTQQNDYEIPDLGWIVYEVAVYDTWDDEPRRAAHRLWIEELVRTVPPDAREPFVVGMR
ncbi:MAG TPA: hypothetical protein VGF55_14675 [Gemmataceae bacterium]|jgi:hypothetical protein